MTKQSAVQNSFSALSADGRRDAGISDDSARRVAMPRVDDGELGRHGGQRSRRLGVATPAWGQAMLALELRRQHHQGGRCDHGVNAAADGPPGHCLGVESPAAKRPGAQLQADAA